MLESKKFEDFQNEANQYRNILIEYKNTGKQFVDNNFHPNLHIQETEIYVNDSLESWVRVDEMYKAPLFQEDLIHSDFIKQGNLGDCYLLAALSRIAKQSYLIPALFETNTPNRILGKVKDSINIKSGAVVIYFNCFGRRTPVLIDTLLPLEYGQLRFSSPSDTNNSPWFCLVEKAYAKLYGSYSNIVGGNFPQAIYNMFGYYPVIKDFSKMRSSEKVPKMSLFESIMKYQDKGAVMGSSIELSELQNGVTQDEIESKGLMINHCYLLIKAREACGKKFLCLRNPWGDHEWNGDWSDGSPLWTPQLEKELKIVKADDGTFWMSDKDFFKYFTCLELSKPFPPEWYSKRFFYQLVPGDHDGTSPQSSSSQLDKRQNFAFQVTEPIENGKNCRFHILIERHQELFDKERGVVYKPPTFSVFLVHNSGKKIDYNRLPYCKRNLLSVISNLFSVSYEVSGNDDIVTIAIHRTQKCNLIEDCYVLVFCDHEFNLWDIDKPDEVIDYEENPGIIFNNFTSRMPSARRQFKLKLLNEEDNRSFGESRKPDSKAGKIGLKLPNEAPALAKPKDDEKARSGAKVSFNDGLVESRKKSGDVKVKFDSDDIKGKANVVGEENKSKNGGIMTKPKNSGAKEKQNDGLIENQQKNDDRIQSERKDDAKVNKPQNDDAKARQKCGHSIASRPNDDGMRKRQESGDAKPGKRNDNTKSEPNDDTFNFRQKGDGAAGRPSKSDSDKRQNRSEGGTRAGMNEPGRGRRDDGGGEARASAIRRSGEHARAEDEARRKARENARQEEGEVDYLRALLKEKERDGASRGRAERSRMGRGESSSDEAEEGRDARPHRQGVDLDDDRRRGGDVGRRDARNARSRRQDIEADDQRRGARNSMSHHQDDDRRRDSKNAMSHHQDIEADDKRRGRTEGRQRSHHHHQEDYNDDRNRRHASPVEPSARHSRHRRGDERASNDSHDAQQHSGSPDSTRRQRTPPTADKTAKNRPTAVESGSGNAPSPDDARRHREPPAVAPSVASSRQSKHDRLSQASGGRRRQSPPNPRLSPMTNLKSLRSVFPINSPMRPTSPYYSYKKVNGGQRRAAKSRTKSAPKKLHM